MNKLLTILIQVILWSASSASAFLISSIVMPLKPVPNHYESHVPRMNIELNEFSPAFAALEDDYALDGYEAESIPQNVVARQLTPGQTDLMATDAKFIELPQISMNPQQIYSHEASQKKRPAKVDIEELRKNLAQPAGQNMEVAIGAQRWVQGKIELTEGLALTDPRDQIVVGWFVDGQKQRNGSVSIMQGNYEVKVDRLEGEIIAELIDRKGFVLGEAVIDLEDVAKTKNTQPLSISGIDLRLKPYHFGFKAQTLSVYDTPTSRNPVGDTQVTLGDQDLQFHTNEQGELHEEAISHHSTALLVANRGQYRESLLLADLENEQMIRMFPEKFMRALFDTVGLEKNLRDGGVIWGLVKSDQVPASGYKVRLADHPEVPPVYFNMYIADPQQTQTSTDGQYVIMGLADGEYEIEVLNSVDQLVDSKLIVVRAGAVSVAEFDVGTRRTLLVKTFDPLSAGEKSVEFFALGNQETFRVKTEEILRLPVSKGNEPVLVYTKPEDSRVEAATFASRNRKYQELPVLNFAWWSKIQNEFQIKTEAGVIVGFVDSESSFEAFVERPDARIKILYFNQAGQIIERNKGQKPSGFVIYNAGQGLHTLIIESEQGLIYSEAAYVDGEAVALLYKSL